MAAKKKDAEAATEPEATPEPVTAAEPATTPADPKPDRTMTWTLAFLVAVAVFAGGFALGRTTADESPTAFPFPFEDLPGDFPGDGPFGGQGPFGPDGPFGGDGQFGPDGPFGGQGPFEGDGPFSGWEHGFTCMPLPAPHDGYGPDDEAPPVVIDAGGYLGIGGVDRPASVQVVEVAPGSPADEAGIEPGDRIVSYDGTPVESMAHLARMVRSTQPGTEVEIVLGGGGGPRTVTVTIAERPDQG